jgi:DNA invertase Pin-like site-specific DNA recombinase
MLGLFAEIERDLIRMRVNEGVKAAQEKGVKFGRPKGVGKSRLDQHKKEIMHLLENGATRKFIAASTKCLLLHYGHGSRSRKGSKQKRKVRGRSLVGKQPGYRLLTFFDSCRLRVLTAAFIYSFVLFPH